MTVEQQQPSGPMPAPAIVGFAGLGIMGEAMARNLLRSGKFQQVVVWNRTPSKCEPLASEGAQVARTPAELAQRCDVVFGMLADPAAAEAVVFSAGGLLEGLRPGKGYVDMSTVDAATSSRIAQAVTAAGGRFLEAPVSGSKQPAIDGQLIILAAGDAGLYEAALPAFDIMGKRSFLLGEVGAGARMKLVVNMVMGSMMTAFAEGLALAGQAGLDQQALLEVLDLGAMSNPMFRMKGPGMLKQSYPPAFPLKHQQKDLRLALALGDELAQPLPVAAAANEAFKAARAQGQGNADFSAVFAAVAVPAAAAAAGQGKEGAGAAAMHKVGSTASVDRSVPQGMDVQ